MPNPYKKIVLGFDSLSLSNEGIYKAEEQLVRSGFSFEHNNQTRALTISFDTAGALDQIISIFKLV